MVEGGGSVVDSGGGDDGGGGSGVGGDGREGGDLDLLNLDGLNLDLLDLGDRQGVGVGQRGSGQVVDGWGGGGGSGSDDWGGVADGIDESVLVDVLREAF